LKSTKESKIEEKILELLFGKAKKICEYIFKDEEIHYLQEYANTVSIKRLGYNDHGPVHMRQAALNAIRIFKILHDAGIKFSLEKEEAGNIEDSLSSVIIAALLHDLGMSVTRDKHEFSSLILALPIIERILKNFYPNNLEKQIILRSLISEGILGHMGTTKINSLEAGLILIGDGCDMQKGRARIPILIGNNPQRGDIHKYSADSILKVTISKGKDKPVKIDILMDSTVGFFQIEEVLIPKINSSPLKSYIELDGTVVNSETKRYF
jgi:metal-dependent HD superfamily phosphatase/phosphodiesterase